MTRPSFVAGVARRAQSVPIQGRADDAPVGEGDGRGRPTAP